MHIIAADSKMFKTSFSVSQFNPDIVSAERCQQCSCCTSCCKSCDCAPAGESEVEQVLRILGIDPEDSQIQQAERSREMFVQEELMKMEGCNTWAGDEHDEEEADSGEDDYESEEDYAEL